MRCCCCFAVCTGLFGFHNTQTRLAHIQQNVSAALLCADTSCLGTITLALAGFLGTGMWRRWAWHLSCS